MRKEIIDKIFEIFKANNPEPETELKYKNNFTLLIAVLLSAQTKDKEVNKATEILFEKYLDPKAIFLLGEDALKEYIKTINFKNTKAKNIINLSKILLDNYGGSIPSNFNELVKLPGIGRKSANVILNCAFGQKTIPVDTHVYRVARRIGLSDAKDIVELEEDLLKAIDQNLLDKAHHWLVLHGRYVCKAIKPDCGNCLIKEYCRYYGSLTRT